MSWKHSPRFVVKFGSEPSLIWAINKGSICTIKNLKLRLKFSELLKLRPKGIIRINWYCESLRISISHLFEFIRREIFENLVVGKTFYALQNGPKWFLKFDPWIEIWHPKVTYLFKLLNNHGMLLFLNKRPKISIFSKCFL